MNKILPFLFYFLVFCSPVHAALESLGTDGYGDHDGCVTSNGTDGMAVYAVIKPNGDFTAEHYIFSCYDSGSGAWRNLKLTTNASGQLTWNVKGAGTLVMSTPLVADQVYHVVALSNGDTSLDLYVDGVDEGTLAITTTNSSWGGNPEWRINSDNDEGREYKGVLMEIGFIYNTTGTFGEVFTEREAIQLSSRHFNSYEALNYINPNNHTFLFYHAFDHLAVGNDAGPDKIMLDVSPTRRLKNFRETDGIVGTALRKRD